MTDHSTDQRSQTTGQIAHQRPDHRRRTDSTAQTRDHRPQVRSHTRDQTTDQITDVAQTTTEQTTDQITDVAHHPITDRRPETTTEQITDQIADSAQTTTEQTRLQSRERPQISHMSRSQTRDRKSPQSRPQTTSQISHRLLQSRSDDRPRTSQQRRI